MFKILLEEILKSFKEVDVMPLPRYSFIDPTTADYASLGWCWGIRKFRFVFVNKVLFMLNLQIWFLCIHPYRLEPLKTTRLAISKRFEGTYRKKVL